MTDCPSESILRLIGTEAIGEATFARLEGHVEHCPECQKILEGETAVVAGAPRPALTQSTLPTLPGLVIEREIGRGATSVVYLAWEPELKRHVAVKLFTRNSLIDPHSREHWLAEARALSRVPHDHVVAIHRVGETEEWVWLVLEHVSGGTLKDRLAEPLGPRDAALLTEILARAVGHFHSSGLWHLDLKPLNILLEGAQGAACETVSSKISDFGIARLEGEPGATQTGANGPKGTPSYMAPEQVACLPGTIGPAADIHAVGAQMYHLLTGRPPFLGASSAETLDQVRNEDPVPPRRLNRRIPRDLETICLKCLEKVPDRRYSSAFALAGDLRLWLDGRPIAARRVSPIGQAWRWCRRHPAVAGLIVALAMTLITGVVGLVVLLKQAEFERTRLAEARRNAEAYEKFSASAADQLASFLRTTIRFQRNATRSQMTVALLKLRSSTGELRERGILPSTTIGFLEEEIGWALVSFNKSEEAQCILNQAISDLNNGLEKNPADEDARVHLCEALEGSGELAEGAGQLENALYCYEQLAANRMAFGASQWRFAALTNLYKRVQVLADRFGHIGRTDRQERSRRLDEQILRHLLGSELPQSEDTSAPNLETLRRLFRLHDLEKMPQGENQHLRQSRDRVISQWLALAVEPVSPFRSLSCAAKYDRDTEVGATELISALRERCLSLGLADSMIPETINVICDDAVTVAVEQRKLGRLGDARATTARLMALARRLVREYPDCANSHRILSEAHNQIKKNAYQTCDYKLAEEAIILAIEAAQRVLALDPDRLETRRHLDKLTEQLASLRADQNARGSPVQ